MMKHIQLFVLTFPPSEFSNEKNRVDRRMQYYKFREQEMFVTAMTSYLDWITQAGFYFRFVLFCPNNCVLLFDSLTIIRFLMYFRRFVITC